MSTRQASTRQASTRWTRPRGDDGAMAVFVSILLVTVLLPVTALGLTSYTRSAVQAEKSRAADSGALAGAAALVLLDVSEIPLNPLDGISTEGVAFTKASAACNAAAAKDQALSQEYATAVSCVARYSPDTRFASCADDLFDLLPVPVPTVVVPPVPLPPLPPPPLGLPPLPVPPVVTDVVDDVTGGLTLDLRRSAKALVPGLLHNGVTTTLTYRVIGPLDGLLGQDTPTTRTAVSTARRRFKPLLPRSILDGTISIADREDFNVYAVLAGTLGTLEQVIGEGLTDLPVDLPGPLADPVGVLPANCRPALVEVVQDLRDALKPAPPEVQDALACVQTKVLGLRPLDPLRNLDDLCTSTVFRAQLAPDA